METLIALALGTILFLLILKILTKNHQLKRRVKTLETEKGILSSIIRLANIRGLPPKDLGESDEEE